jgi:nicotinamidase-related amidase
MARSRDLHGFVPDSSKTVVVVLDMVTDLDFPDGPRLRAPALAAARRIRALVDRADRRRIPVVYVNDNVGRWKSDAPGVVAHCKRVGSRGQPIVERIEPGPRHYFVLKPKHSAFYGTPLDVLLEHIGARKLVLTGVSSHQCILFTATDAHVREYEISIPRDCVAAPSPAQTRFALKYFEDVLGADTRASAKVTLRR